MNNSRSTVNPLSPPVPQASTGAKPARTLHIQQYERLQVTRRTMCAMEPTNNLQHRGFHIFFYEALVLPVTVCIVMVHCTSLTHESSPAEHCMFEPGSISTTSLYVPLPPTLEMTTLVISAALGLTSEPPMLSPGTAPPPEKQKQTNEQVMTRP